MMPVPPLAAAAPCPDDRHRSPRWWPWPLLLGLSSTAGLLAGLLMDGPGEALGWLGLGLPLARSAWDLGRAPRSQG
jgi:hypothetical protein